MKTMSLILLIMLSSSTSVTVDALEGNWEITMKTPRGERVEEVIISKQDDKYIAEGEEDEFEIDLDGNNVTFVKTLSTPMGDIDVKFEGELDGDEMEGEASMTSGPMEGQKMEWSASRQ